MVSESLQQPEATLIRNFNAYLDLLVRDLTADLCGGGLTLQIAVGEGLKEPYNTMFSSFEAYRNTGRAMRISCASGLALHVVSEGLQPPEAALVTSFKAYLDLYAFGRFEALR